MNNGVNRPSSFEEEVVYKECLHNMAASLGKDSFDGCRQFMKAGEDGTMEALKCAACGCHRNFHRKDFSYNRAPVPQNQNLRRVVLLLPAVSQTAARIRSRSKDENAEMASPVKKKRAAFTPEQKASPVKKKRAAFTPEQKNQMVAFAERYDWKVYRRADKEEVERFCMEIGIDPYNFKVWLGNQRRFSKVKNNTTTNGAAADV